MTENVYQCIESEPHEEIQHEVSEYNSEEMNNCNSPEEIRNIITENNLTKEKNPKDDVASDDGDATTSGVNRCGDAHCDETRDSNDKINQINKHEFELSVKKWVKLDDQIKELMRQAKGCRQEKKELTEKILGAMNTVDETTISISDGKIRRNVSKTKTALTPKIIEEALVKLTQDNLQASKVTEFIMNSRTIKERITLKRTRRKNV